MARYTVGQFVRPFKDLPIADPDDTIGQVLEFVTSSHQPVYVFDNNEYLGLVTPYQALYRNFNTPYQKKVSTSLSTPPRLFEHDTLYSALQAMLHTRLYQLPVLTKKEELIGVINLREIMQTLSSDRVVMEFLSECIDVKKPITHSHEGTVEDIYNTLQQKDVSRIVLLDDTGKVNGIVGRSDIQTAFIRPNLRQRFRGIDGRIKENMFDSEETYRDDDPIARYSSKVVFTLPDVTPKNEILSHLISSDYKSVVLVNQINEPIGFLSLRDVLHCLATIDPGLDIPIVFEKPCDHVTQEDVDFAYDKIVKLIKKLQKIRPIEKVEITVNEQKYPDESPAEFTIGIIMNIPGNNVVVSSKNKDYLDCMDSAIELVEKQFIKRAKHNLPNKNAHQYI